MPKLSVAIASFNEEKNIKDCLATCDFADELVVVDGKSEDKTPEIAKKLGAKVYSVPNQPLMKKNMNLAFEKCTGDWILSLDADERVSPDLQTEIRKAIDNADFAAYKIPRKNIIFGKWIEHTGWYPDFQYRLFKKGQARFPEKNVHEELEVDGSVGELEHPIIHHHYETISQWLAKLDSYTTYESEKLFKTGKKIQWHDAITFPVEEFLSRFFARHGYKDGLHGLVLSLLMAFYWEVIFAKLWEHEKFWQYGDDRFLEEIAGEGKIVSNKYHHWVQASTPNPLLKLTHKIRKHL